MQFAGLQTDDGELHSPKTQVTEGAPVVPAAAQVVTHEAPCAAGSVQPQADEPPRAGGCKVQPAAHKAAHSQSHAPAASAHSKALTGVHTAARGMQTLTVGSADTSVSGPRSRRAVGAQRARVAGGAACGAEAAAGSWAAVPSNLIEIAAGGVAGTTCVITCSVGERKQYALRVPSCLLGCHTYH